MTWSSARALAALARRECQLSYRSPAFWAVAGAGALLSIWRASSAGTSAALAAYGTLQVIVLGVGVLSVLLAGAAATRDRRQGTMEIVLAKPGGSSPALLVARFVGTWGALLALPAVLLAAAAVSQGLFAGTGWNLYAYADGFLRSVIPVGLAAALGFSLSSLFTTPLASAIAAIYWVVIPLTRPHVYAVLDLTPSQHWPVAVLAGMALVALAAAFYARPVRGERRGGTVAGWAAIVLLVGAGLAVLAVLRSGEDNLAGPDPILAAISMQTGLEDRLAPGFWLPDPGGRLVAMSDFGRRPAIVYFWGPAWPDSARGLRDLELAVQDVGPQNVTGIAVCLDRDAAAQRPFRREVGRDVVMLWDRGRHFGGGEGTADSPESPLAIAYDITEVPTTFVLDANRRLVARLTGEFQPGSVRRALAEMVADR